MPILGNLVNILSLKVTCWKKKNMRKLENLKDFDKGPTVMARPTRSWKIQICWSCGMFLVCSARFCQKWSKQETTVNWWQCHGWSWFADTGGGQRLANVVQCNRKAIVAQIAEKDKVGSDRMVSEHIVQCSLMQMALHQTAADWLGCQCWPIVMAKSS